MANSGVVRHDKINLRFFIQATDDVLRAAFEHLDDRTFETPTLILAADTRRNAIAMHHFAHLPIRQDDRCRSIVGMEDAVTIAVTADGADDERQSLAQAQLIASVTNDLTAVQQRLDFRM